MDIIQILKDELQINRSQVEAAVKLIDEGNTIPFIARYRKEATGSLNDEVLRNLDERLKYLRNLEERKAQVINSIREQEKLTPELEKKILSSVQAEEEDKSQHCEGKGAGASCQPDQPADDEDTDP